MPLKTCFDIKTDICDQNLDNSQNPYVAKFQKWPRMLCIDPLEGPMGLVSFANFLTPNGASRQVCDRLFIEKHREKITLPPYMINTLWARRERKKSAPGCRPSGNMFHIIETFTLRAYYVRCQKV